ncbi:glycosyltransferase [Naumannella halotolerans]|uniref:glycosyltransferase n=1 Tax=Naumannella halotolerans TaxID=993414 RepID=UPI00370D5569
MQSATTPGTRTPRISLIGPVRPYRGGIAQYTTSLADALSAVSDLTVWSFDKLYPERLYPGASDVEEGAARRDDALYSLHALNPISWLRTAAAVARTKPDLVLINWWTVYWQPAWFVIARYLRARGIKVVYLVHNLADHDAPGIQTRVSHKLLTCADGYVVHGARQREILAELSPGTPVLQRPHPVYDYYPAVTDPLPRRRRLELLFFGFIRPYKGLDVFLDALRQVQDPSAIAVSVVGESWDDPADLIASAADLDVELVLRYVSNEEAAQFFERADAIVLPYRSATGSGIVASAYHHGKPVIASDVPGLDDVVDDRTGWLFPVDDSVALAAVIDGIDAEQCRVKGTAAADFVTANSWPAMARAIVTTFTGRAGDRG